MPGQISRRHLLLSGTATAVALTAPRLSRAASGPVFVDASAPTPAPQTGQLVMGSQAATVAPDGTTLTVDSQSLLLDGKPWVPVAGEFHYSRYPADEWLPELLKMKAAGIDIVSTYIIWIHHEEIENQFIFSDSRDVASFVRTAAEAGLKVIARLGPYVHAEVRNGGLPDWVLAKSAKIRSNDPAYLSFVQSFWTQIMDRIAGLTWKSGGPIIAVQLENEYSEDGSGQGAAHIATLKSLAISLGMDVPLYTCTGWQGTHYPPLEVVPVFGGYQDAPWDTILQAEPPSETYSFRFFSRERGDDGYPEQHDVGRAPNSPASLASYPFLTAEYGAGAASMYRRRVVMALPDDIASILPVQIGSGVNLLGYYMFHGGVNPRGLTEPLQESTASRGFNDLPVFNYDYQSAIGQYGQQRPTLNRLKQFHYWLNEQGHEIAGMSLRQPAVVPYGAGDLESLRWSVRSNGSSGYLFVNNYIRQHAMAAQQGIQFTVKFAGKSVTLPSAPISIASGSYFIWPLNLALGAATLVYATAQLMTSVTAFGQTVAVFVAADGIPVEFAFDPGTISNVETLAANVGTDGADRTLVTGIAPGVDLALRVTDHQGTATDILVLTQAQADDLWRVHLSGQDVLLLTNQSVGLTAQGFALTSASPDFSFATFPAIDARASGSVKVDLLGVFTLFAARQQTRTVQVSIAQVQAPGVAPPILTGGEAKGALEPTDAAIATAQGLWNITIPWNALSGLDDIRLNIDYTGDLARLYAGSLFLDDSLYDGQTWTVGLKRLSLQAAGPLTLAVMPLRSDAPIYLQAVPSYGPNGQACVVNGVTATPIYSLAVTA